MKFFRSTHDKKKKNQALKLKEEARKIETPDNKNRNKKSEEDATKNKKVKTQSTFRFQETLPQLPIPDIQDTCKWFLEAALPLATDESQTQEAKDAVNEFLANEGPLMQSSLQRYATTQENYVDSFWDDAYLYMDESNVINVNPFFVLQDDPNPGRDNQLERASRLVYSTIKFLQAVRSETLAVDMVKKTPLCMSQYPKLLGTARIPDAKRDKLVFHENSKHIVVICNNQFYYFNLLDEDGGMLMKSEEEIMDNLIKIIDDACSDRGSPVGVLTSETRSNWAASRKHLSHLSENNATSLEMIDSAIFVLCLDNDFSPANLNEASQNALRGISTLDKDNNERGTCMNRWYDKLQIIVCENGSAHVNFEHAPADGHSVLRMVSDVFTDTIIRFAQTISGKQAVRSHLNSIHTTKLAIDSINVHKIEFDVDDTISQAIHNAHQRLLQDSNLYRVKSLEFTRYGKKLIVKNQISPDAFAQMCMMAATHKVLDGAVVSGYESVMTKAFRKGRTEAGRPMTNDAKEFMEAFNGGERTSKTVNLLRAAAKTHSAMTSRCSKGNGFDRHLYALKCCWKQIEGRDTLPKLFSCELYKKVSDTVLSTSNCGNPALRLFGFGPVSTDGVGIGYIVKDHGISFSICSGSISVDSMEEALTSFLNDMKHLLEEDRRKSSKVANRASMLFGKKI